MGVRTRSDLLRRVAQAPESWFRLAGDLARCGAAAVDPRGWGRGRRPRSRKHVAFQAYSIHLAQLFGTVVARLRDDPDIRVTFVVLAHPHFPAQTSAELRAYTRDVLGVPEADIVDSWETLWEDFDLLVCTDVYARFPLRRTRTCLLAHGPGLSSRFFEAALLRKTVFDFDVVAVNGPYDHRLVEAMIGGRGRPRVCSVGFPFLDRFEAREPSREAYCRSLGLDPQRPLVVFAPHWEPLRGAASIDAVGDVVAALAAVDAAVVVKPHACALNPRMARGIDWRALLGELSHRFGVAVDLDPDDIPAIRHADALITDISSRACVGMSLGKTVVAYEAGFSDGDQLDLDRRALVRSGALPARTPADIARYLRGPRELWPVNTDGTAVAGECFAHRGRATETFVELIRHEVGLAVEPGSANRRRVAVAQPTSIGIRIDTAASALGEPRSSSRLLGDAGALRQRLAEDGYLFFRGFFDAEAVATARRQVVGWLAQRELLDAAQPVLEAKAAPQARIRGDSEAGRFPAVRALLRSPSLLRFYEDLLGGPVRVYDHIWMRLLSPGNVTGPHGDIVYMGRGTTRLYTSWVPLGDVPLEHGALLILEGSHRLGQLWATYGRMDVDRDRNWRKIRFRHGKLFRGGDYSRDPRAVQRQFGLRWLTTDYAAGDLVVLTAQTLHGSLDNVSDVIRISADTRYQLACEPIDERWVGAHPVGHSMAE